MDSPPALPPRIDQALAHGWTVLTANQRAARTLRHAFDRRQRALGHTHWQPPSVLAWETWLATQWHRLLLDGHTSALLLNARQEHTLWRAVIEIESDRQRSANSLRPIDALADLAAGAWLLLHAYRARRRLTSAADSADTRAFAQWATEFERRCSRANYLTQAELPETLREAFVNGKLQPAPHAGFLLVGFDTKTPAQIALLEALQFAGAEIEEPPPAPICAPSIAVSPRWVGATAPNPVDRPPKPTPLVEATDLHDELTACARWLRNRLTHHPNSRVAVIVPSLEAERAEIDRTLRNILAPELEDIAAPAVTGPFEFSLGVPLAHTAMVATALDILRWAAGPLPLERITSLLLSPHFVADPVQPNATSASPTQDLPSLAPPQELSFRPEGLQPRSGETRNSPAPASEYLARAEFDAFVLRRQHLLQPQLSINYLYDLASRSKSAIPVLQQNLRTLLFRSKDLTADSTYAEWAAAIHDLLEAAGWTSTHDNSIEFQTRRRWESALDELTTLDFDSPRVPFITALAALERVAAQTLFAPESRHAPIQIMGPLEAAGSTFDAVWFLRAGELTWPAAPAPHPLLPWRLQRELAMPGVDPASDSAVARRITERIAASAPTVLFSYAQTISEGHQRASPLLATLALEPHTAADIALADPAPAAISLEAAADDTPIPPPPDRIISGGASILQAQAQCGFRAFAEKRLFASALEGRDLGLDPRERGNLVHKALEHFWGEVQTQAALKAMPRRERNVQLTSAIDAALTRFQSTTSEPWSRAYLSAERTRLLNLLNPWLDFELTRPPFAVHSREEKISDAQIGPLRLDIRVDRVDSHLIDGEPAGEIILDYKTGPARPTDWLGERPDAPQLPLYAVIAGAPHLAAIAFASVRAGTAMEMSGYEASKGVLPKSTKLKAPSLEAQVDEWRTTLEALAESFHSGDASVSPKQYPRTCLYCEQRLLCRLDPTTLDADALEDLDPSETEEEAELA
jgi:hypothetical protein